VGTGDEVPLVAGVVQPAKEKVFALPGMDLTEHRFNDRFASGVSLLAGLGFQLPGHPLPQ